MPAPSDIPDGTQVLLTIAEHTNEEPLPPDEITRILAAMQSLGPWEIPENTAADLNDWEQQLNNQGLHHREPGLEGVFP